MPASTFAARRNALWIALIVLSAPALALEADEEKGVTILRGSSAPPPPPPAPSTSAAPPPTVIYREIAYPPVPPTYVLPGFVVTRPSRGQPPASTVPDGWPLLGGARR
jgi:hypothetical protein